MSFCPVERKLSRQRHPLVHHVDVVGKGMADDFRLFVDLLGHEVLVIAFVDQSRGGRGLDDRALDLATVLVADLGALAREHRPVAVLQVADRVSEGRKRDGVRAEKHLDLCRIRWRAATLCVRRSGGRLFR